MSSWWCHYILPQGKCPHDDVIKSSPRYMSSWWCHYVLSPKVNVLMVMSLPPPPQVKWPHDNGTLCCPPDQCPNDDVTTCSHPGIFCLWCWPWGFCPWTVRVSCLPRLSGCSPLFQFCKGGKKVLHVDKEKTFIASNIFTLYVLLFSRIYNKNKTFKWF